MIIETYILDLLINTKKIPHKDNKVKKNNKFLLILTILKILFILIAIYLSWDCNSNENIFIRLLYASTAGLFSGIYILFYSIYRILLGNKCI